MAADPMAEGAVRVVKGIHEIYEDLPESAYNNKDIAPTKIKDRKWATKDFAVLWIAMAACVPTYMLASGLISEGMNWWQAIGTIILGNIIVLIPMVLNAHAGTKYGIPFPVYCRPSFGVLGANIPAMLRALVACGWFGIQAWIGGGAIYAILAIFIPSCNGLPKVISGYNAAQMGCFLFFWAINIFVIYKGIDTIRILLNIKAPLLIALGLALLAWAYQQAGGFGEILAQPSKFVEGGERAGQFWVVFFPALTGMIGFWATLSLNIPDFTRYARSQKDQIMGQCLGLPTTMGLYAFIGVAVTSATAIIYGKEIWDPIELLAKFENPVVLIIAMLALCIATLATNIAANVVSPANDFSNLWPAKISFKTGGYITGVIGILIQPWNLLANSSSYIFVWLNGYSALLGAVGGVLIADYYVIRKTKLHLAELYAKEGRYWYSGGFNPVAIVALLCGILPCLPGFLGITEVMKVPEFFTNIYHLAWFISFTISFVVYAVLTAVLGKPESTEQFERAPAPDPLAPPQAQAQV